MRIFAKLFLFLMILPVAAQASEAPAPQFSAGGAQSFSVNSGNAGPSGYVRGAAKVTGFTATSGPGGGASGSVICATGSWQQTEMNGVCFAAGTDTACNCAGECNTINYGPQEAFFSISQPETCNGSYCFYEAEGGIGKTGHDDMFFMKNGADGFINFRQRTGTSYWLRRSSSIGNDMMIPTSGADYNTFIHSHPGDVQVEYACRPGSFTLCPSGPPHATPPPNPPCCPGQCNQQPSQPPSPTPDSDAD